MYANNRFGHPDFGTHYVVLAYDLSLNRRPTVMLDSQHSVYEWMDEGDLKTVHQFTKAYFQGIVSSALASLDLWPLFSSTMTQINYAGNRFLLMIIQHAIWI